MLVRLAIPMCSGGGLVVVLVRHMRWCVLSFIVVWLGRLIDGAWAVWLAVVERQAEDWGTGESLLNRTASSLREAELAHCLLALCRLGLSYLSH